MQGQGSKLGATVRTGTLVQPLCSDLAFLLLTMHDATLATKSIPQSSFAAVELQKKNNSSSSRLTFPAVLEYRRGQ